MTEFTRKVDVTPAYDRRSTDPKKNYGIGSCDVRFILKKDNKAVQFVVMTCWYPQHIQQERGHHPGLDDIQPWATDLGYHSPVPMYEGQQHMTCTEIDGGKCYYDGSSLNAKPVRDRMLEDGSRAVWEELEQYWHEQFAAGDPE